MYTAWSLVTVRNQSPAQVVNRIAVAIAIGVRGMAERDEDARSFSRGFVKNPQWISRNHISAGGPVIWHTFNVE